MSEIVSQRVRACLITNPRSGRGGVDLTPALHVLDEQGWDVSVRQKLHGGHATQLAREAVRDGFDVVVDCGGDGTLSEIIDGVVGTGIAVGTLPGGTVNLWARELGISRKLQFAAMQLIGADRRRVDVGKMDINGRHSQHFLLMAGLGLDGAVMERVSKPLKNHIGPLAVGVAAVRTLPTYHTTPVKARLDGIHWEGDVAQIVVGNTRRYAGFTRVTAGAFVDDGLLDVCFITKGSAISTLRQLSSLLIRKRPSDASAEIYRAASLTVHAPKAMPAEIDGGAVSLKKEEESEDGVTFEFSIISQGVTVLVPRTYDGELFRPDFAHDGRVFVPAHPSERQQVAQAEFNAANGKGGDIAHVADGLDGASEPDKKARKTMRVVSVGVESLVAARLADGRVVTIEIQPDTTLTNGSKAKTLLWGRLSALAEGDIVRVKGEKNRKRGVIVARRLRLLTKQATV